MKRNAKTRKALVRNRGSEPKPALKRSLLGARQRERTKTRIIEAAMRLFAVRSPYITLIEHIVQEAGVARGTFYYYFDSMHALREDAFRVATEMHHNEMKVLGSTPQLANPIVRFVFAARLFERRARADPLFAFLATSVNRAGATSEKKAIADLKSGLEHGLIEFESAESALAMAMAVILHAVRFPPKGLPDYLRSDELMRTILYALRANDQLVEQAMAVPLPRIRRLKSASHATQR